MSAMFEYCTTKGVNLSTINTSNVTDMSCMFYEFGTPDTVLNLTRFNTSNVKYFYYMFAEYKGKQSLDLSMFDTRQGKDFYGMFLITNPKNMKKYNPLTYKYIDKIVRCL